MTMRGTRGESELRFISFTKIQGHPGRTPSLKLSVPYDKDVPNSRIRFQTTYDVIAKPDGTIRKRFEPKETII